MFKSWARYTQSHNRENSPKNTTIQGRRKTVSFIYRYSEIWVSHEEEWSPVLWGNMMNLDNTILGKTASHTSYPMTTLLWNMKKVYHRIRGKIMMGKGWRVGGKERKGRRPTKLEWEGRSKFSCFVTQHSGSSQQQPISKIAGKEIWMIFSPWRNNNCLRKHS